ncbi:hypothetical protein [Sulfurimonas sp.]|uniref:phage major tropism determinant n=1 Tax=Sulfurimonas sp. TaxID=2022749 RepID=UPI0025D547D1|nr:hypothetical protein [Sulfurimonas sp.]
MDLTALQTKINNYITVVSSWVRNIGAIYFDSVPADVTVQLIDEDGNVVDSTIPNRAKILSDMSNTIFDKLDVDKPIFEKVTAYSIKILLGFRVRVGENTIQTVSDFTLDLNVNLDTGLKTSGTDYYVFALSDGGFIISASKLNPDGFTSTNSKLIGGFHYGLIPEDETPTGNKTTDDMTAINGINKYSFWDLKFRPISNPEGMVYIGGKWYDIYLLNSEHITNGTSKANTIIAAGTTDYGRARPKIPLEYGGDGNIDYGSFKWIHTTEIAKAHSKELISYEEFMAIAYGVNEGKSSSTNGYEIVAGKVEHYSELTSKYGIEQATGVQYLWGKDLMNGYGTTSFAWKDNLEQRGQVYSTSNSPTAVLLGGDRDDGVNAGSRASNWDYYVWSSGWGVGCRFACDHMKLV